MPKYSSVLDMLSSSIFLSISSVLFSAKLFLSPCRVVSVLSFISFSLLFVSSSFFLLIASLSSKKLLSFADVLGVSCFFASFCIIELLTFFHGISTFGVCFGNTLLTQVGVSDFERPFNKLVVRGCFHTVLLIACSCFCNIHGAYPVLIHKSTTSADVALPEAGGSNFIASSILSTMLCGKDVFPPAFI